MLSVCLFVCLFVCFIIYVKNNRSEITEIPLLILLLHDYNIKLMLDIWWGLYV